MQLNLLYLVIVSAGVAISSAVNPANLTATNAATDFNSPLEFTAWTGASCTGYMFEVGDISRRYKWQIILANANGPFSSFRLSRPLKEREQLDFSQTLGSNSCGRFLHSYWPRDSPAGCANLNTFGCIRIWLN